MLTLKEIYEKATSGIIKQGVLCTDFTGQCVYRNSHGHACGVGQLIDDEYYTEKIEGLGMRYLGDPMRLEESEAITDALFKSGVDVSDNAVRSLLIELQGAHDDSEAVMEFLKAASYHEPK